MDWKMLNDSEWRHASFNNGVMIDGTCYMARNDKKGIFCWDTITNQLRLLFIDKGDVRVPYTYGLCVSVREMLYFIPCCSDYILEYDLKSEKWYEYKIDVDMSGVKYPAKFYAGFFYGGNICLVPKSSTVIGLFDVKTKKISYLHDFYKIIKKYYKSSWDHIERGEVFAFESVWMLLWDSNVIIQLDLKTYKIEEYKIGRECERLRNIDFDGENFWLTNQYGDIFCWNDKKNSRNDLKTKFKFHEIKLKIIKGKIWIFPFDGNEFVVIDILSHKERSYEIQEINEGFRNFRLDYYGDGILYLFPYDGQNEVFAIDLETKSHWKIEIQVKISDLLQYRRRFLRQSGYIFEMDDDLNKMIAFVNNSVSDCVNANEATKGSGIYRNVIYEYE